MKYFDKILFALFFVPLFSIAQSNYKPGYVVTLKGDTLHGFIDYRAWYKNPKHIRFKTNPDAAKTEDISVKNAGAFSITGAEYYQRFTLHVSQDQVDVSKLPEKADINYIADTVFLQVNNKGKYLTLYSYTDEIKQRFYVFETGGDQPKELIYSVHYVPGEAASVQYIKEYRNQLENLAEKLFDIAFRMFPAFFAAPSLTNY